jgi:GNAT superfamily N-acetyltransferase
MKRIGTMSGASTQSSLSDPAPPSLSSVPGASSFAITIRPIAPEQTAPLRHAVLWPTVDPKRQLLPYDHLPTTHHFGAFILSSPSDLHLPQEYLPAPSDQRPVGVLTVTLEPYARPERLPPSYRPAVGHQLHKFGVLQSLQGQGVGRRLLSHLVDHLTAEISAGGEEQPGNPVLLHFDARANQRGFYERLGMEMLDPEIFIKRGPTGDGPPSEYVRMGKLLG